LRERTAGGALAAAACGNAVAAGDGRALAADMAAAFTAAGVPPPGAAAARCAASGDRACAMANACRRRRTAARRAPRCSACFHRAFHYGRLFARAFCARCAKAALALRMACIPSLQTDLQGGAYRSL